MEQVRKAMLSRRSATVRRHACVPCLRRSGFAQAGETQQFGLRDAKVFWYARKGRHYGAQALVPNFGIAGLPWRYLKR